MDRKNRLELTWIGKDRRPRLEPRVLLECPEKSYHAAHRVSDQDSFDNRLIHGDNLLALKALEQEFAGEIKCIYVDPPFNTDQAFEHYDDSLEHSIWLTLIRDRVVLLHRLLSQDGTLFVHIDDNELAYLVAVLDEVFGRNNRISIVTFKQGAATGHKAINPGVVTTSNFVLIYAKSKQHWRPNRVFTTREERDKRYTRFIENRTEQFANWQFSSLSAAVARSLGVEEKELRGKRAVALEDSITSFVLDHADQVVRFARPDYGAVGAAARAMIDESRKHPNRVMRLERDGVPDMYFVGGERVLFYSDKLKQIDGELVAGEPLTTIWDDLLSNNLHNEGGVQFPKGKKPEALIKRCLELVTEPGDWVLDSFAGSGTTGAAAHKMRRRWILIEVKDHAESLILPRLRRTIDGEDTSGITQAMGWTGGGGFRFYRLAPSLLVKDRWGNWVISDQYNSTMLAEALCKIEGFIYAPSEALYWQHGYSSERDFIYVTTAHLNHAQLQELSDEVGPERTLLVLCTAFRGSKEGYSNLTVRKIPKAVLSRCEWGKDDYSLNVENLPAAPPKLGQQALSIDGVTT